MSHETLLNKFVGALKCKCCVLFVVGWLVGWSCEFSLICCRKNKQTKNNNTASSRRGSNFVTRFSSALRATTRTNGASVPSASVLNVDEPSSMEFAAVVFDL